MRFSEVFREIIGTHFPSLFLQTEENLLNYLKELLLNKIKKDPDFFDEKLDFFTDNFAQTLKKMVNAFTDGLESIGVSPVMTSRKFYSYFKEIPNEPGLNTPSMWLYQRFRPFIRVLLADEIIHFFEGSPGNIIEKFADFDIISSETYEKFKKLRDALPNFSQFIQSFNSIHQIYADMDKVENLLLFERMEENLQALYFLVQIFKDLGEHDRFNTKLIKEFLTRNQSEWTRKTPTINPASPSTILSVVTIVDTLNINTDLTPVLEKQKEQALHLLEMDANLLKAKPSELYDVLLSIYTVENELYPEIRGKISNLSLTPDLIVDDISIWSLGTILETLFLANPSSVVSVDVQKKLKSHLQRCRVDGGYSVKPGDSTANPIASYYAFRILQKVKILEPGDLKQIFKYFTTSMERLIKNVDFGIPETIAEIFYCHKFFSALENEPGLTMLIEDVLECGARSEDEPIKFCEPGTLDEQFHVSRKVAAKEVQELLRSPRSKAAPEAEIAQKNAIGIPNVLNLQDTFKDVPTLEVPVVPEKAKETDPGARNMASGNVSEISLPRPDNGDVFETLRNFPRMDDASLERFRINYRDLMVQPPFFWNSIKIVAQYYAILKMLHVQIRTTPAEIENLTRKFLGSRSFLSDDLAGEDIVNTCYGLCLYTQFNLLTKIPLAKMQEFLVSELGHCLRINREKALYVIFALKFIAPDIVKIPGMLPIISDFQVAPLQSGEEGHKFEELFHFILLLKAFRFDAPLNNLKELYARDIAVVVGVDGSVDRLVTQTAWGLIGAVALNMNATHPQIVEKMAQYLQTATIFFSEDIRRQMNWQDEEVYFALELDMFFWALVAVTMLHPSKAESPLQKFCPKCGQYFRTEPRFCNMCGYKFGPA